MRKDEDEIEDSTKYGEFVSSYFAWLTLEGQKERADELNNITKKNSKIRVLFLKRLLLLFDLLQIFCFLVLQIKLFIDDQNFI